MILSRPFKTRFRCASGPEGLKLASCSNLSVHYAKGTPSPVSRPRAGHRAPTACRFMISGSISLPSPGFFSTFPHGTRTLSVRFSYLGLAHGRAGFTRDFPCPALLGIPLGCLKTSNTGLSPSLVGFSNPFFCPRPIPRRGPATPVGKPTGLACSLFARRYSGNPFRFLFLEVLRCFNSLRIAFNAYGFSVEYPGMTPGGFPHSEISGSRPVCGSPEHIAAYHVLHRRNLPSHPS